MAKMRGPTCPDCTRELVLCKKCGISECYCFVCECYLYEKVEEGGKIDG